MRLRNRGERKRYVEEPLISDDDEPIIISENSTKDDDFEEPSDGPVDQEVDDDEEEGVPTSDDELAPDNGDDDIATSFTPKKQRNVGAGKIQSRKSFHEIPLYPLESRIVTRVYAGPLRRYARYSALRDVMFGPEYHRIKIIWDLEIRWANFPILPPKRTPEDQQGILPSPWLPRGFEREQEKRAFLWYEALRTNAPGLQRSRPLSPEQARPFIPDEGGDIITLVGPWDKQKEYRLRQGSSLQISDSGYPVEESSPKSTSTGWMFDVGGIPLAVAWAPSTRSDSQILAVATVPFSDQTMSNQESATNSADGAQNATGCIQFWEFIPEKIGPGQLATPSAQPARFLGGKCFNWGRPKRLQFAPVPMECCGSLGILAVLCGDGKARVIDIKNLQSPGPTFDEIETPIATFNLSEDYKVDVTCLTWVNTNRLALGHSDGSITLWSVFPQQMLQRVGVHTTYVIDICSAYPSSPYLVASIPVGGCATLTDLSQPSSEFTYFPVPAINFQPNLLCWNESMQGFMALYPSSTPNTTVAFLHHRYFCQARSICTGPNTLTCVSAGVTHPFILAGCADGSIFSCNGLQKLFKQKGEPLRKLKIFEHEYRPVDSWKQPPPVDVADGGRVRGAARILQGFLPEPNDDPRTEKRKEMDRKKRLEKLKRAAGKKKRGRKKIHEDDEAEDREAELDQKLASRVVIHEPLTRLTTIAWNPNVLFSCWAACAMASGLIKVMDLGVDL